MTRWRRADAWNASSSATIDSATCSGPLGGSEVQPHRRVHAPGHLLVRSDLREDLLRARPRPEQPRVTDSRRQQQADPLPVHAEGMRLDNGERARAQGKRSRSVLGPQQDPAPRAGKPRRFEGRLAVIDERHAESRRGRKSAERDRVVARPEDHEVRRRIEDFEEDVGSRPVEPQPPGFAGGEGGARRRGELRRRERSAPWTRTALPPPKRRSTRPAASPSRTVAAANAASPDRSSSCALAVSISSDPNRCTKISIAPLQPRPSPKGDPSSPPVSYRRSRGGAPPRSRARSRGRRPRGSRR